MGMLIHRRRMAQLKKKREAAEQAQATKKRGPGRPTKAELEARRVAENGANE